MIHDHQQQTGRTTRMLLAAILAASEGRKVLVVGRDHEHAAWLYDNARRTAGHIASARPRSLHIGETGVVQFSGPPTTERAVKYERAGYLFKFDHDSSSDWPGVARELQARDDRAANAPRTLDQIVAAVRSGESTTHDETRRAVVAFDVLLAQLDLPRDPVRLQAYFVAAESVPADYIGEANDPDNAEAVGWYKAMHNAGAAHPDVRQGQAVRDNILIHRGNTGEPPTWQCPDPECRHRADPFATHDDCAPF